MLKLNTVLATFVALTLSLGAFAELSELEKDAPKKKITETVVTVKSGDSLKVYIVKSVKAAEVKAIAKQAAKNPAIAKSFEQKIEKIVEGLKPSHTINRPANELENDGQGAKQACFWGGGWGCWGRWWRPTCFNYCSYWYRPCYNWGSYYVYC